MNLPSQRTGEPVEVGPAAPAEDAGDQIERVDVAIVDDHLLLSETVVGALAARGLRARAVHPETEAQVLHHLTQLRPRVVLLDLDLGAAGDGARLIRPLTAGGSRVVVLSGVTDRIRLARTVALGAVGLQPKGAGFGPLLDIALAALHTCGPVDPVAHQGWLTELAAAEEAAARRSAPFVALTEREQATLRALCEGLMVHDISRRWTVSEATVRSHVQKILAKLGVGSQVQAVGLALREGWVPVPTG